MIIEILIVRFLVVSSCLWKCVLAAVGILFAAPSVADPEDALSDAAYIQVVVDRKNAGLSTYASFRLFPDGQLLHAEWTSRNVVSGQSDPAVLGADEYEEALRILERQPVDSGADLPPDVVAQPGGNALIFIPDSKSGYRVRRVDAESERLRALLSKWSEAAPVEELSTGIYLWARPLPVPRDNFDFEVNEENSDTDFSEALLAALSGPALLVRMPEAAVDADLLRQSRAGREHFFAELMGEFIGFGLVRAE
ncbi:hypothetical protein KUV28_18345 [Ferrimonas balearica]|nr:hypothetical protein [Ferrimonas balearica]